MYTKKGIAINFYNLERWFYLHHLQAFAEVTYRFMQFFLGCTIPYTVDLEKGCHIPHWHGIVMNEICKVGSGSYIFQNVTLGGAKGKHGPKIGKNCVIGAGAVILGEVNIGDNCRIGANAVVIHDVPANCTAVGVPVKIIRHEEYDVH